MPRENLKEKLEGNELDLSLNNLTEVPVKQLAEIPKATHLDLSCNLLADLPDTFCTLTYLVKIDLSKNLLTKLPDDFGNLVKLQHLDLLGNKLTVLPVSLYQLNRLKWLDLKDNQLVPELKKVAGDCLDEKQCKKCAIDVVAHMKEEHNKIERKLQLQRDEDRKKKAAEEMALEKEKQRMAEEKKKKKQAKKQAQKDKKSSPVASGKPAKQDQPKQSSSKSSQKSKKAAKGRNCCCTFLCSLLLTVVFVLLAMVGVLAFCQHEPKHNMCEVIRYESVVSPWTQNNVMPYVHQGQDYAVKFREEVSIYADKGQTWAKENGPKFVNYVQEQYTFVKEYAIEQYKSFMGEEAASNTTQSR